MKFLSLLLAALFPLASLQAQSLNSMIPPELRPSAAEFEVGRLKAEYYLTAGILKWLEDGEAAFSQTGITVQNDPAKKFAAAFTIGAGQLTFLTIGGKVSYRIVQRILPDGNKSPAWSASADAAQLKLSEAESELANAKTSGDESAIQLAEQNYNGAKSVVRDLVSIKPGLISRAAAKLGRGAVITAVLAGAYYIAGETSYILLDPSVIANNKANLTRIMEQDRAALVAAGVW